MGIEQYRVKPEEWNAISEGWNQHGMMNLADALWYLLGFHPVRDSSVEGYAVEISRSKALVKMLDKNGVIERQNLPDLLHEDVYGNIVQREKQPPYRWFNRDKAVRYYENNPHLGRPPFLFEDARYPEELKKGGAWPWGVHDTKLLQDLAAAANRFWKNYDPDEIDTAPRNEDVSDWLIKERKLSKRLAESMATILRPDGLPTGPRQ